ncbi:MAG: transcriptional regulator [Clostridiaceae bacterium]|nr:MAG: transcriptional regulator [Clostridiaceae bacterium]
MELYYVIAITDHDRGEAMNALYRAAGLRGILSMPGRGTATSEHLAIYGLDATEKYVISAVGNRSEVEGLIKSAKRKLFIDIPGNGVMLTVPLKSVAGGKTLAYLTDEQKTGGAPRMDFEHELIIVILNEGYSDFVMDAARAAGAGGGTVLHAKGTGGTRGEKFFSVSLADEKDMIYIIAHKDEKAAIMRSINEQAGPGSKAGAICFSLPISSVAGLRAREEN